MPAFFKSKTIWSQLIKFGLAGLAMFGIDVPPETQAQLLGGLVGVFTLVDVILRYMTKEPMSAKKGGLQLPPLSVLLALTVSAVFLVSSASAWAGGKKTQNGADKSVKVIQNVVAPGSTSTSASSATAEGSTFVGIGGAGGAMADTGMCGEGGYVTLGPFSVGYEDKSLCRLWFQLQRVCSMKAKGVVFLGRDVWDAANTQCTELRKQFIAWEPSRVEYREGAPVE